MRALTVESVDAGYRGGAGIREVCIEIAPSQVLAVVGLNGAGKTTLMRAALGMLEVTRGQVRIFGKAIHAVGPEEWRRVGQVVDAAMIYPELTVAQNLTALAHLRGVRLDLPATLAAWELSALADRRARHLSLGNTRRLALAGALAHRPDLVVLDEPTNALDPAGVITLREQVRERAVAGGAVLVSSHHLDEVARIADRIVVMNRGRVVGELDPGGTELERALFETVRRHDEEVAA